MSGLPKQQCDFYSYLRYHGHGERCFHFIRNPLAVGRTLSLQILGVQNLLLAGVGLLFYFVSLVYMWRHKNWGHCQAFVYLSLPVLLTIIEFMFYHSYIYRQYFLSVVPFGLLFLGYWQDKKYLATNFIWIIVLLANCYFFWQIFSTKSFGGFY